MKKKQKYFFVFTSLLIYTISVCGITINKHFCSGELESISLVKQKSCCGGEMEDNTDDGCCANETVYISNKSESINHNGKITIAPFLTFHQTLNTPFQLTGQFGTAKVQFDRSKDRPPSALKNDLSYLMIFRI